MCCGIAAMHPLTWVVLTSPGPTNSRHPHAFCVDGFPNVYYSSRSLNGYFDS
jgi:hypothetical protein